jgi:dTDP-4-amino-4,6-dideoxygalactose transaminase
MAAVLLGVQPGDEVIVPSFTFVTTVSAFVLRGAKPVFLDIRSDTLNIDETKLDALITPRTKAIVPVHYAGVACEMDTICEIAARRGVAVVEDNAHGLFGKYKGKLLGTFGCMATQSFHETKNICCGEGGALVINDEQYSERAEIIRQKGTNRSRFFRGEVDKYSWVDLGSSYLPSDILAAFLYAQLEHWQEIAAKRELLWNNYDSALRGWIEHYDVRLPYVPENCEQAYHMYYLLMPSQKIRTRFIDFLKHRGILSVFHYLPLHLSSMGMELGGSEYDCPVTCEVSDNLVRLPFYNDLTNDELSVVISSIKDFIGGT